MVQFTWLNIRSYNNSQNNAFEELVCQLAREEDIPNKASFTRVGAPDGGVEAYCVLENGDEYGWQAKYFNTMGDSQWVQLEKSFKTAFSKHPHLVKYYICIPLDRQDPRIDNQKWFMDKWNEYIDKWKAFALEQNRTIEFEYWGSSELLERLSQEKHAGRRRFWFNSEEFSEQWFCDKLDVNINCLGNRYTPELNYELEISKTFDGILRGNDFKKQFDNIYNELKKSVTAIIDYSDEKTNEVLKQQSYRVLSEIDEFYNSITIEMNEICYGKINEICNWFGRQLYERIKQLYSLKDESKNNEIESSKINSEIHYIRKGQDALVEFQEFIESDFARLANIPIMLLRGDAGIGKSHLLADIARKSISKGSAVILLLGQHFTSDDNPWNQILRNQLRLNINEDEFLGALNAKAQATGSRALIIIDAINEGRGRFFWKDHIKGFIKIINKYKWIGLVLSVRTSYEEVIVSNELISNDDIVKITHSGFAGVEYEVSKLFFNSYRIQQPSIPLLHPEFQNPLFLKLFCEGLNKARLTVVPDGLEGITKIVDFYISTINKRLSEPSKFNYSSKINLVKRVINLIITRKTDMKSQHIAYEDAYKIISNEVKDYTDNWRQFLDELINEGVMTQNVFWIDKSNYIDAVYFAYERFDDHFTASYLLERYLDKENPEASVSNEQPLFEYVKDEMSCRINKGLIEAFSIQLPEITNKEFFEIVPFCKSYYSVVDAFIGSLIWRRHDTIDERIIPYINDVVLKRKETSEKFWDTVLQVASNPKHFFNGDRIHQNLMKFSLSERDGWWTIYINQNYSGKTAIKRLVDWAWTTEDRSYVHDDSIRLYSITISWFLTSSNRRLRDSATKALVSLLQNRIKVMVDVLKAFEGVDDPYVYERIFGVAYGCALRTSNKEDLTELCQYVYDVIFSSEYVYPHILLRDYARGIIEYTVFLGNQVNVDMERVKPPYKSEWYDRIPTEEEIAEYKYDYQAEDFQQIYWAQNNIIDSMITEYGRGIGGYGDFGRYIFQGTVDMWEKYFDPQQLSNIAIKRIFELGYSVELHGEYDTFYVESHDRHHHTSERIGKKYQWIAFYELLAKLSDNYQMCEVDYSTNNEEELHDLDIEDWFKSLEIVSKQVWEGQVSEEVLEDDNILEELQSEDQTDLLTNNVIQNTKPKTINYRNIKFNGPWNPFVRDIDPTILINKIDKRNKNYYHDVYQIPQINLERWVHDFDDIPSLQDIIFTNVNGREFILLSSHITWQERHDNDDFADREEVFIKTTALMVPADKVKEYSKSKKVHAYSYGSHWGSSYTIFAHEYFWSQSYQDYILEIDNYEDDNYEDERELKTTTLEYLWEKEYDNSIEESVSFLMPSEFIVKQLELKQLKDGYWFNNDGQLISYDISLEGFNTSLLIEKEALETILNTNQLAIIWDVYLEKLANKEFHEWRLVLAVQDNNIIIVNKYGEETWKSNR